MEKKVLKKAFDDIDFIKTVLDKTSISLVSFSKIFLWWGILFSVVSIFNLILNFNFEFFSKLFTKYSILNYIPFLLTLLLSIFIYYKISKYTPLKGLGQKLMTMWIMLIVFNVLYTSSPAILPSFYSSAINLIHSTSQPILLFTFGFGLFISYIFTDFSFLKWLALVYIILGFMCILFMGCPIIIRLLIWPVTFLCIGGYLELQKVRRD